MRTTVKWMWRLFFLGLIGVVGLFAAINYGLFGEMPSLQDLKNPEANSSSEVYAADGTLMGKYYLENRSPVDIKDISKNVIDALIATEDVRYYEHSGIDGKALLRAVLKLGKDGGGSTLTQQLAKNLFSDMSKRTKISRSFQKFQEWVIAVKLEKNFTKDEILNYYLNTVPWGRNAFGIRNASRMFFSKEPDRLNVEEAALLVGMLKANSKYDPINNPVEALQRRNVVMNQMVVAGKLTQAQYDVLKLKPIKLEYKPIEESIGMAPYMREEIRDYMKKWCKEHKNADGEPYDIYRDGLKIYTTIQPKMQLYAEEAVAKHVSYMQRILSSQGSVRSGNVWNKHQNIIDGKMESSERWKNMKADGIKLEDIKASFYKPIRMKVYAWNSKREKDTTMTPLDSIKYTLQILQSGFLVMDPMTGEVKAWVGGVDFKTFKRDHVGLDSRRQVGSIMKPFLYCQAIEEAGFTPETPVPDQVQFFPGFGKVPNENACSGRTMPLKDGIAYSKNGVAAYLMKQISPRRFSEFVKNANIQNEVKPYPSMALGACDLSLYEMMWGYTMFPGRGFSAKPLYITKIEDRNGNVLQAFVPEHKEVISELTAYTMAKMMQGCVDYGTGKAMRGYGIKAEMGAKTGTTDDNGDAWFMGYTPQLLAGCWVGCEYKNVRLENTAVGQGGYAAMPIWAYFFKRLYEDKSLGYTQEIKFEKPPVDENSLIAEYFNNSGGGGGGGNRPPGQLNNENGNGEEGDYAAPLMEEGGMEPDQQLTEEEQKIKNEAIKPSPTTSSNPAIVPTNLTTNPAKKDTAKATMAPTKKEEKKDPKKEDKNKSGGGTTGGTSDYKRK